MIRSPAFYKLLEIPESAMEPTAYHLLGLDPRTVTEALVDHALRERKIRLRSNIPGPQFIPIVSRIEQELESAAATLRDPASRQTYNESLLRGWRQPRQRIADEERRKLVRECGRTVRSMVDADGCLPPGKRGELAERLERLGLPATDIRYVLDNIPESAAKADAGSAEAEGRAREQAMQFFLTAVDLEFQQGPLSEADERKLLAMAERFGIAQNVARRKISSRRKDMEAAHPEEPRSEQAAQFKLLVQAMYPMGDATEVDRRRLLSLAATQGLNIREAEKVLQEHLPRRPRAAQGPAPAGTGDDALEVLQALAADSATAPRARQGGRRERSPARYVALAMIPLMIAVAGIAVYAIVQSLSRAILRGPTAAVPVEPNAVAEGPSTMPAEAAALWNEAMTSPADPPRLRQLFERAGEPVRLAALRAAADTLVSSPTRREQAVAEAVFRGLLHCPPAAGEVQDAALVALLDRLSASAAAGQVQGGQAYRAAGLLVSTLFLRPVPGVSVTEPREVQQLIDKCRRAWQASRRNQPWDPANDPRRLAAAVADGGILTLYGERADPNRFAAVAAELVAQAADPNSATAGQAFDALITSGGYQRYSPEIQRVARLALCRILEVAPAEAPAGKARATLAAALALDHTNPLRAAPLSTPQQRQALAADLRLAVNAAAGLPVATQPAATQPAVAAQTRPAPAAPPVTPIAQKVRAAWGPPGKMPEVLTDLATCMLACTDRVARFSVKSDDLTRELADALDQKDHSLRAARLTRQVRMAEAGPAGIYPVSPTLDAQVAEQLEKDLRSTNPGVPYQAVERLRGLDGHEAATILIKRLGELARGGQSEYPLLNRILRALPRMHDRTIPAALAELVEPARSNYAAHRIVMTLLEGCGRQDLTQNWQLRLPVNHGAQQRNQCAAAWRALAASCPWGPGLVDAALPGLTGPPPAWKPSAEVEKLLALFGHHAGQSASLLHLHRPVAGAEAAVAPDLRPGRSSVTAPLRQEDLPKALERLTAELERLARSNSAARNFSVQLDMVMLTDRARMAACETTLQRAAARLDTAGRLLEILLRQADKRGMAPAAIAALRPRHDAALAAAQDVLTEMREHCLYCLMLLELLPAEGP